MANETITFTVLPPLCEDGIDNHVELANNRIADQYKFSENLKAVIESLDSERIQILEDVLCTLGNRFSADASEGQQLDLLGEIVGVPRLGRSDDVYRLVIKVKGGVNNSEGTIEDIITIWKLVTNATEVELVEYEPATIEIQSNARFIEGLDSVVRELFKAVVAGGVKLNANYYFENSFAFEGGDPQDLGFGDHNNPNVGGRLSTIIV